MWLYWLRGARWPFRGMLTRPADVERPTGNEPCESACSARQSPVDSPRRYRTEDALVRDFVEAICSDGTPFPTARLGQEFDHRNGRTDVVSMSHDGDVFAFEAKLTQWRVALHQAYRNTAFANRSYVVLPASVAERAGSFPHEFERRKVGLCAVQADGSLRVVHSAPRVDPLMPWVSERAAAFMSRTSLQ